MPASKKAKAKRSLKEKRERKSHKDWFDKAAALAMAKQISTVHAEFDSKLFKRLALQDIESLEFNDRVKQFSDALHEVLPDAYPDAIDILVRSLPPIVSAESVTDGWLQWPVGQFIADYGTGDFKKSMLAMTELTQRFSSEYAVRPFVEKYPKKTFAYLVRELDHPSEHVRRWCSEGTRTRLPWGIKLRGLINDPAPVFSLLEKLLDDDSLYVRKSVANNVNDLSKDHPQLVLKKCRQWQRKNSKHRDWIIKQGLRTLIKQGTPEALKLVGFGAPDNLDVKFSIDPKKIPIGHSVNLQVAIKNNGKHAQSVMIDYVVHYVRKNNVVNEKVFKWKTLAIKPAETANVAKAHSMKKTTIRELYSGVHNVEVQINGVRLAASKFTLA